ncbi:hypothetical protein AYK20_02505 [Thermoplasmatales archaeon SG8-52-1]|nr:MAG: hypothetical protein AYK20_02505 [Thermoplasmatales archaeon SG8-52-1]
MSNLKVEIYDNINDINKNQWDNIVEQSYLGSFFHRYGWIKSIEEGIGYKGKHLIISKNDNLVGILPNFKTRIIKAPFNQLISITPGFGGPIITGNEKEVLDLMLKSLSKMCRGNIILHCITTLNPGYQRYNNALVKNGYQPNLDYCRFVIDLDRDIKDIILKMDKKRRYNLKKGSDNEFKITDEKFDDTNLKDFFDVYTRVMEKIDGVKYPFNFFISLKKNLHDRIKMFSVKVNGKKVGQHLYFLDKEQSSLHHFFSAVSESDFKYYPSELLHEHGLKWGIQNNYKKYDFGGTGSDFNDGLFKFKEEFGGHLVPTLTWEKSHSLIRWNLFKVGRYFYRKSQ